MDFQSKKLYPIPMVKQKNIEYAKLLLQDYAGGFSEDTAVHLYMYQNFVLSQQYPKIANDLFQIAIVEMHHLKLLGKTILLLGLPPEFVTYRTDSERKEYWSSKFVPYKRSLKEILEINIQQEQDAINTYLKHYEIIKDQYIQELLLRIIEDEKIHLDYFKKQLFLLERKNMD